MPAGADPGTAAAAAGPSERLDLIDAAIYADLFDCAVTAEELWRHSRAPVSRQRMLELLEADPGLSRALSGRDGLYCLRGREPLLAARAARRVRARRLRRRADRIARVLGRAPFVRGLLLTGSAGADDAPPGADLDLLVLVEPGRLATVFTLLGSASRLLGRSLFCPNHYIALDSLDRDRRRDIYVAHEIAQAGPLYGRAELLGAANGWVRELLPNALNGTASAAAAPAARPRLQRLLEWPLRGRVGAALELRAKRLARSRLAHHHGPSGEVPGSVLADLDAGAQLRFHGGTDADDLLARYERRREEIAELLA